MNILLVEDDEDFAILLARRLRTTAGDPIHLRCVTDLASARAARTAEPFDAIVLDLNLPDSPADATLAALPAFVDIPVVVLTTLDDPSRGLEAIQRGAQDYLPKDPIDGPSLRRALRYACERHSLQRQLDDRRNELEDFSRAAAHDLRAPLRQIQMFAKLLREQLGPDVSDRSRVYLDYLVQAGSRLSDLVEDLLLLARCGAAALRREVQPLQDIAVRALDLVATPEQRERVQILPLGEASVDEHLLLVVFQNLLGNALRYGGDRVRICVEPKRVGDGAGVCVRDDGPGVPPSERERILRAFERGSSSSTVSGTGLGLPICERAILRHGGVLWLEDNPDGQGLAVCFTLGPEESGRAVTQ